MTGVAGEPYKQPGIGNMLRNYPLILKVLGESNIVRYYVALERPKLTDDPTIVKSAIPIRPSRKGQVDVTGCSENVLQKC
jgi:hypothetical protein